MRKRCFNTMHVAMEVGADSDLRDTLRAMGSFGSPLSHARRRTESGASLVNLGMVGTAPRGRHLLFELKTLRDCNLVVDLGSTRWSDISDVDPAVIDDDARAQFIVDFAASLIRNRCKVMMQYSTLYPWRMGLSWTMTRGGGAKPLPI